VRILLMGGFSWDQTYGKTTAIKSLESSGDSKQRMKSRFLAPCAGMYFDLEPSSTWYVQFGVLGYFPRSRSMWIIDVDGTTSPISKQHLKISRNGWGFEALSNFKLSRHIALKVAFEYKAFSDRGKSFTYREGTSLIPSFVYQKTFSGLIGVEFSY
jgi:hypothetical protein